MIGKFSAICIALMRMGGLAAKFGITLFIAKYLSLEALGVYGLIVGAAAIVPIFFGMGLIQLIARESVGQSLSATTQNLKKLYSILLPLYLIVALGAFFFKTYKINLSVVVIVIALEHVLNDASNILIGLRQPLFANFLTFLRSAVWIILYAFAATFSHGLRNIDSLLLFWLCGSIVTSLILATQLYKWPWRSEAPAAPIYFWLKKRFLESRNLYFSEIASNISYYSDRYLVGLFIGITEVGVYVFYSSIGMAIYNLVNASLMQTVRPLLISAHIKNDREEFRKLHKESVFHSILTTVTLSLIIGVCFFFGGSFLGKPELTKNSPLLWIVLFSVTVRVVADLEGYKLYTQKLDRLFLFSTLFCLLISLASNVILLYFFGLPGACFASIFTYGSTYIVRKILTKKFGIG